MSTLSPLQQNEAEFLRKTVAQFDYNKAQAARYLCISRETLYRKLWKYRLIKSRTKSLC